jgi:hypothetical protein
VLLRRLKRPDSVQRVVALILALAVLMLLPACWVTSINPLYDDGTIDQPHNDPEVVFDQSLIGSWTAVDDKCTTLLTISSKDQIYDLQSTDHAKDAAARSRIIKPTW